MLLADLARDIRKSFPPDLPPGSDIALQAALEDFDLVRSIVTCTCCNEQKIPDTDLTRIVGVVADADEFNSLAAMYATFLEMLRAQDFDPTLFPTEKPRHSRLSSYQFRSSDTDN